MLFVAYRLLEGVELWAVINPNLGMDDTRHDYTRDLHAEPPTCALSTGTSTTTMNSTVPSILAPSILRFYPAHVRRAILITLPNHPFLCVLPRLPFTQARARRVPARKPPAAAARLRRVSAGRSAAEPAGHVRSLPRESPNPRPHHRCITLCAARHPNVKVCAWRVLCWVLLLCRARGGGQRRAGLHLPAAMRGLQQALPQPRQVTSSARLSSHKGN